MNELADRAFRRHYRSVYRYVRRRTGDHDRAEDITQQVFADAVDGLEASDSPPLAWLYTVARRRFVDQVRRDAVARRLPDVHLTQVEPSESRDYGADLGGSLRAAIEALPAGQRDVVVLKLLRGASFAEIGTKLGISSDAAKMRFVRALEGLRSHLEEEGLRP